MVYSHQADKDQAPQKTLVNFLTFLPWGLHVRDTNQQDHALAENLLHSHWRTTYILQSAYGHHFFVREQFFLSFVARRK